MDDALFRSCFRSVFGSAFPAYADPATEERFLRLTDLLLSANRAMNLTAVTQIPQMVIKHYADCAFLARLLPENANVLDVGAGAGFPTLPLAILRPDLTVTALDSTEKRMLFVADTAQTLHCPNVRTAVGRAEERGNDPEYREAFDCVTARAVARLDVLCELCLPLCRTGGSFFAMKGAEAEEELRQARYAAEVLGGEIAETHFFSLPDPDGILPADARRRSIVQIRKMRPSPPGYPRRFARMRAHPLADGET